MIAVILAGGSGTRFWPLSREARPKQLVHLYGGRSMLEHTIRRVGDQIPTEKVLIVCGERLVDATRAELPWFPAENVLAEPVARNTGPAVGLAAAVAMGRYGDEIVAVLPSDHYVRDDAAFRARLAQAEEAAEQGYIVTLGIQPSHPETGYGYIRYAPIDQLTEHAYRVEQFIEKPHFETAVRFLESGDYVWNAGIFVFRPSVMLAEFRRQQPQMYEAISRIAQAWDTPNQSAVLHEEFGRLESISVDYAIMERAQNVACVPISVGWSDVGHWAAIGAVLDGDAQGNLVQGEVLAIDTRDSLLFEATEGVMVVVGLDGVVVVRTEDAVLVIPRHRAQDVRFVVDALRQRGLDFT